MLTSKGYIKRTTLSAFANIRVNGLIAISLEEGDALRWVRLALPGDSVLIGSRNGMTIHFRLSDEELRPLGRTARGVRSMNLRGGDRLVSMDVLPAELADRVAEGADEEDGESEEVISAEGPWVLVASASGLGKRVPVQQFRLQKRAGMGLRAMRFRREGDVLIGLKVLGSGEELLLVSEKGVIVRMQADAVPQQSRAATGVRLQRLDAGDHLAEVVLVPPAPPGVEPAAGVETDELEASVDEDSVDQDSGSRRSAPEASASLEPESPPEAGGDDTDDAED
jgi:DNA gyrase subunit A